MFESSIDILNDRENYFLTTWVVLLRMNFDQMNCFKLRSRLYIFILSDSRNSLIRGMCYQRHDMTSYVKDVVFKSYVTLLTCSKYQISVYPVKCNPRHAHVSLSHSCTTFSYHTISRPGLHIFFQVFRFKSAVFPVAVEFKNQSSFE